MLHKQTHTLLFIRVCPLKEVEVRLDLGLNLDRSQGLRLDPKVVDVGQVLVEAEAVLAKAVALREAGVAVVLVVAVVVHQGVGAEVEVVVRIVL